jgi:argininosuccinate lyase
MENLIEGLQRQMNRVREIIKEYDSLPGGAGAFASSMMKLSIKNAEKQIANGDTIEMMKAYTDLDSYEL